MSVRLYASGKSRIDSLPAKDRGKIFSWLMDFANDVHGWGNRVHRVEKRQGVWTARIDDDYRAVLVQDGEDWCVIYVGRHDDAYRWAERRDIRIDDGNVTLVLSPEAIGEIQAPVETQDTSRPEPILSTKVVTDAVLEGWGINSTARAILRSITDVETLLEYVTNLPQQVADLLLGVACGDFGAAAGESGAGPLDDETAVAPAKLDIRRTFYIVDGNEDLMRVIEEPMASWIAFLHPSQHRVAYGRFNGPVKVSGGAGTGKTVVALHRARHLARQGRRVLLTTYADTLCANLREQLALLCTPEEQELIRVSTVHQVALGLCRRTLKHVASCTTKHVLRSG